ncbi:MAG TPA: trypsin-like peptidase domain-containing protein [Thermoanaerobaculia bacterium]|jgi:S1-C subfamily serine protease|nr:trypsin-like peptidase domain-containing protein [Thermoanaerobaculia bacterium]
MSRAPSCLLVLVTAVLAAAGGFRVGSSWAGRAQQVAPAAPTSPGLPGALAGRAQRPEAVPAGVTVAARGGLDEDEKENISIFERSSPAVVFITSLAVQQDAFSLNSTEIPQGSGSGFVWDRQGHVVTNYHVVAEADVARVTLADQSNWEAKLVGAAPEKDVAVLKIDAPAERLHPLPLGTSEDLKVGQKVFAIGNPFGLDQTLTTGIISALGREIQSPNNVSIRDVIQTDAAINPGNSGGPLLDSAGRLIGVNAAIYSPSGASAGIGFAIPAHAVEWAVPDLIRYGRIQRPTLGVQPAPEALMRRLGLEGSMIYRVTRGSGAARAGLQGLARDVLGRWRLGDVILSVDGQPIASNGDLLLALEGKKTGQTVHVGLLRDGRKTEVAVQLGEPSEGST